MTDWQLSADDRQRLVDALLEVRLLRDVVRRNQYVSELEAVLGRSLDVPRHREAQADISSVLTGCLSNSGGLRSFVGVIRDHHGDTPAVGNVERLVKELERGLLLTPDDREELCRLIVDLPPGPVNATLGEFVRPARLPARPHSRDLAAIISRVELLPVTEEGWPPLLLLVGQLACLVGGFKSRELNRWIDLAAKGLGLSQADVRDIYIASRHAAEESQLGDQDLTQEGVSRSPEDPTNSTLSDNATSTAGAPVITTKPPPTSVPEESVSEDLRLIWGGVPIRNPDFTGRAALLRALREALETTWKASVLPQTLHGFGGVGKTQLAVEYVYQYVDRYDLVWWIAAEHPSMVLASLARLGERLGLPETEDLQQAASNVLDSLGGSSPHRWLLVFDNADQPDDIARFVPSAGGHVIITSRNQDWGRLGDAIEVDVFERAESIELLRKRGEGISPEDADRLADKLGDLPLALEQAATWQSATGMPVPEYLQLFDEHVRELLSEGKPTSYPTTVAALFTVAYERLRASAPAAAQLLELFAYLGAEPVTASLLRRGRDAPISEPLSRALREPIYMSRTLRELRRYGLAKVDPNGQRIQVHRLVQRVLRESLSEELAAQSRTNVHNLLASANPGEPDQRMNWPAYVEIAPHVRPSNVIEADTVEGRQVALDQIRYRYVTGDYEGSRRLAESAVPVWQAATGERLGPDGEQTLIATRHLAAALRALGDYGAARELNADTLERLRRSPLFGEDHEHTLATNGTAAFDLRVAGDYRRALKLDEENLVRHRRVFGDEDELTLRARNNLAVNLRMLGDFAGAHGIDQDLVRQWQDTVGETDPNTLFCMANEARDVYGLGRYAEALEMQTRTWPLFRDQLGAGHNSVLLAARTTAIALRKTGRYAEALGQARENYRSYHAKFGPDHEHSLAATMSYANTLRAMGELSEARGLATGSVDRYEGKFGGRHPLTLAATTNLAIILRALGELREARRLDERTLAAMREVLGPEHPYTLCAASNLANDLVLGHDLAAARELSEATLTVSRKVRGDEHPYTLACVTNVAFDLQATGDEVKGQALLDQAIAALGRILGADHPETVDAARGKRAECDIEPPPT